MKMKLTKIIATIGPASEQVEVLKEMAQSGLNCIRINMSHAQYDEAERRMNIIRDVNKETGSNIGILIDTKGPELRSGNFVGGSTTLKEGDIVTVDTSNIEGDNKHFSISYPGLVQDVKVGNSILLNNGLVRLTVLEKTNECLSCKVENTGTIKNRRAVNLPGVRLSIPFLSEKDIEDIEFAIKQDVDFLALSFVSSKEDVLEVRELLKKHGNTHIQIISKIENQHAVDNIDAILDVSDGIMVARGDLGVEVPMEKLPIIQKQLIHQCTQRGKISIVATEMLASMEENPRPTRAEVSDVANAVLDGTDAIMLSGETANGKYPVGTVEMMAKIAKEVEQDKKDGHITKEFKVISNITETIARSVIEAAKTIDAEVIVASTMSGYTARKISNYRPNCPILATSPDEKTVRKLALNYGVYAIVTGMVDSTDEIIRESIQIAKKYFQMNPGDKMIITGGFPIGTTKTTNLMKIEEITE